MKRCSGKNVNGGRCKKKLGLKAGIALYTRAKRKHHLMLFREH
jgi:hypothetical protein